MLAASPTSPVTSLRVVTGPSDTSDSSVNNSTAVVTRPTPRATGPSTLTHSFIFSQTVDTALASPASLGCCLSRALSFFLKAPNSPSKTPLPVIHRTTFSTPIAIKAILATSPRASVAPSLNS